MVGIFTPQKLADAANEGSLFLTPFGRTVNLFSSASLVIGEGREGLI